MKLQLIFLVVKSFIIKKIDKLMIPLGIGYLFLRSK